MLARTERHESNARAWGEFRNLGWSSNRERLQWLRKRNTNWDIQTEVEEEIRLLEEEAKDEQELANWQKWKEELGEWTAGWRARRAEQERKKQTPGNNWELYEEEARRQKERKERIRAEAQGTQDHQTERHPFQRAERKDDYNARADHETWNERPDHDWTEEDDGDD